MVSAIEIISFYKNNPNISVWNKAVGIKKISNRPKPLVISMFLENVQTGKMGNVIKVPHLFYI